MKPNSVITRKGKATLRDYSKISNEELEKLCFVNADKEYITNVIREGRQQVKEGRYIVVKKSGKDVCQNNAV